MFNCSENLTPAGSLRAPAGPGDQGLFSLPRFHPPNQITKKSPEILVLRTIQDTFMARLNVPGAHGSDFKITSRLSTGSHEEVSDFEVTY